VIVGDRAKIEGWPQGAPLFDRVARTVASSSLLSVSPKE
jgi:hypothetical protein